MEDSNNKTLSMMLGVFVALIVGLGLIGVIADQTESNTQLTVASETVNIAPARLAGNGMNATYKFHLTNGCPYSTWRADSEGKCALTGVTVVNSTGKALADTTDFVATGTNSVCTGDVSGDISFVNSTAMVALKPNTTTVSYQYCPATYLNAGWTRTILDMVPGFFALALLAVGIFWGIWYYNRM